MNHADSQQTNTTISDADFAASRLEIDRSCKVPVMLWYVSSVVWLIAGSALALVAAIKLHTPGFMDNQEWLSFGRVRPAHLNTVAYGWASMSGIGTMLWLMARLSRQPLPWRLGISLGCIAWNVLIAIGTWQILIGNSTSIEWLEFPSWVVYPLGIIFLGAIALTFRMLLTRRVHHLYVSQWYLLGATVWFPILYVAATVLLHSPAAVGVAKGTANWWYAHNVLGLWLTPIGLAAAYYFIPKVIGRPVHSYYLSLIGFWTLALFYNWAGTHHLIGGPVPAWVVTLGIVGSMMMFVPVIAVAANHHLTLWGSYSKVWSSPTLQFVVFGSIAYTITSVQGSLTALRVVNETTHFTHYTIAHAHLGVYAFYSMVMFGSMYYVIPRLMGRSWSSSFMIRSHFWLTAIGIVLYFVGLSIGGWIQGVMMNDSDVPFIQIVKEMIPYLWSRTIAGSLMTLGHLVFFLSVAMMLLGFGKPHKTSEESK